MAAATPRMERLRKFVAARLWPFLAGLGSAMVMLLAFLIPSLQDQWDRYEARRVVGQYADLGDRFMQEDNYRMAEQAYSKAVDLSEGKRLDIETKRLEARVLQVSQVVDWGDTIPTDLEEVDFQFLLHLKDTKDTTRAAVLNAYGVFLASEGRPKEAVTIYQEAITLAPNDPLIRINQGNLLDELDMTQEAAAAYRAAIALDPDLMEAHYNLGVLLAGTDSVRKAVAELEIAERLDPADTVISAKLRELRSR